MGDLGALEGSEGWPVRRLRALADVTLGRQRSPKHASGPHMVPYLRAANVLDGRLDLSDVKEMNFTPNEQVVYSLKPGDVLITEGSGSLNTVGASAVWNGELAGVVCFQNTLLRARPRRGMDPRYLAWWCRNAFGSGLFASVATGANIFHLSGERVRAIEVVLPPPRLQTVIADLLDREAARIDELVSKKQLLADQLAIRRRALVDQAIRAARLSSMVRIRHLAERITSGPRGWAGYVGDDGEPFLRISNVQRESIELALEDVVGVAVPTEARAEARRTRVSGGDILVSITADIGSVGLVPSSIREGYVSQHLCLIHPRRDVVDPQWLAFALLSSDAQHQLDSARYGGTKTQLALDDVASVQIPLPPLGDQVELARRLREGHRQLITLTEKLDDQMLVLQERRQALITAAVTGELDVARVS